jgi:hypothetical protein
MTRIAEIYRETNPLKNRVSYGSDGVDMAIIAKAEALIASMQGEFIAWFQVDLVKLQSQYDAAASLPVEDRASPMADVYTGAHDMKGQGGSFGFPLVTNIANSLCRFMENRSVFGRQEMEVIQVHIEALRLAVAERMTGDGGIKGEKLLRGLEVVMEVLADR